jgi:hypothetical protein
MRQILRLVCLLALVLALAVIWPILRPPRSAALPQLDSDPTATSTASVMLPLIGTCDSGQSACVSTATPAPTAGPTAGPTAEPTAEPTERPGTPGITKLQVGALGFSDAGTHQTLRTSDDRVYIFAPEIYKNYVRALRATEAGTPIGFAEADQDHRPDAQSAVWSLDAAIDANDVVHVLYIAQAGPVIYQTFDTKTDLWGQPTTVANSAWPNRNSGLRQGAEGAALALDANDVVHVVYGKTQGNRRRLYHNHNDGGSFSHEELVDDQPNNDNSHATLAFGADDALYVAWLYDTRTAQNPTGSIRVRVRRNGAWGAASSVIDNNVFRNNEYSIDQGPSITLTPDGNVHVIYIGPYEPVAGAPTGYEYGHLHHKVSADGGANWTADDPPPLFTHSPSITTDPQGNLYVFGHREYWKADHCANMLVNVKLAGGDWGPWRTLATGCYDSSPSVKWAQHHWNQPSTLELVYWTEHGPQVGDDVNQLYYAEIRGGPATIADLPAAQ